MKAVYLDNNATTQVAPEVLDEMLTYFLELYGNPSSMHSFGGQVAKKRACRRLHAPRCRRLGTLLMVGEKPHGRQITPSVT